MTPLLFIKLTNQTNSEDNTILQTNSAKMDRPEIFKYIIHTTLFDNEGLQKLARLKS